MLQPNTQYRIFQRRPFADSLQCSEERWRMSDDRPESFTEVAILQPPRGLKRDVRDSLRPLRGFSEAYRLQDGHKVICLLFQGCRQMKLCQERRGRSSDLCMDVRDGDQKLAASYWNSAHRGYPWAGRGNVLVGSPFSSLCHREITRQLPSSHLLY